MRFEAEPEWHPRDFEYLSRETYEELLGYFLDHNWRFNHYPRPVNSPIRRGVLVSTAGTGPNLYEDRLFNISLLAFDCDDHGYFYQVLANIDEWEDPQRQVSPEQFEFMGISEHFYRNSRFPDSYINQIVSGADFIAMYNAHDKRKMLEKRFPIFETKPFVCLKHDVYWDVWRRVGPDAVHKLEAFAAHQGRGLTLRSPSEEVLLTAWLLTLPNPIIPNATRFYKDYPSLLKEVVLAGHKSWARIYFDGGIVEDQRVLGKEGFTLDLDSGIWHRDVEFEIRFMVIRKLQKLFFNGRSEPIAWMPVSRIHKYSRIEPLTIPSEEVRRAEILRLPTSIQLHAVEDVAETPLLPTPVYKNDDFSELVLLFPVPSRAPISLRWVPRDE